MSEPNEWYEEGLQFECTMCGACCTGPPGYVGFTPDEGRLIADRLGISYRTFLRRHAHKMGNTNRWSLNESKTEHGYDCVFLDRDSEPGKVLCTIHDVRPQQCRTWPWWPENLKTPRSWQRTARSCEGVGQGQMVTIDQIRIQRDATPT